jgi:small GTP-binding protein
MTKPPTSPSLVIVGRPNVGKSTLFNRLTGTRRSIVTDEPGITRDRIYGRATWNGRPFEIVDTGGMLPEDKAAIPREILRQADVAIAGATGLVLVVDARAGVNPLDADLARRLHATGKPLLIAANKVDTAAGEALAAPFYELAKEVYPVSAEHGTGVDDFLDAARRDFPVQAEPSALDSESASAAYQRDTQIAIIRRPNVGKSTLLNSLVGAERSIVSAEPGTTRDAVHTQVVRNDRFAGSLCDSSERVAHLRAAKLPGGDAAARYPVQAAAGFLDGIDDLPDMTASPFDFPRRYGQSLALLRSGVRTFTTTSVGRLFDTTAALLGFTRQVSFEGQAAIWLEQIARNIPDADAYPFPFNDRELDFRPLLKSAATDRLRGRNPAEISRAFHRGVAQGLCDALAALCPVHGTDTVVLSGGVFQNELLLEAIKALVLASPFKVYTNNIVPSNDGGISLGQAALAWFRQFDSASVTARDALDTAAARSHA